MTTGIEKSPDDPCKFQLQPNEEIEQHAPRQVPVNPQGTLHQETEIHQGNQFVAEPVEEMTECVSSLEIVDKKVPADFNTGKDHSPWETTGRSDSFLDSLANGFKIVDEVWADINTKHKVKDHLQDHLQDPMDHSKDWPWLTMVINPTSSHLQAFKQICQRKDLKHYNILLWCCERHLLEMRRPTQTWRCGKILHSSFWDTKFQLDGLVTKGSFHNTKVHTGTSGKVSMLTMTSRMKVPDLWPVSALPNPQLRRSLDVQCSGPELQFQEAVHGILLNPPF